MVADVPLLGLQGRPGLNRWRTNRLFIDDRSYDSRRARQGYWERPEVTWTSTSRPRPLVVRLPRRNQLTSRALNWPAPTWQGASASSRGRSLICCSLVSTSSLPVA